MNKLALIGKDVSKSDSAKMHGFIQRGLGSGCSYELVSCPPEGFDAAVKRLLAEFDGFNVTIPYKLTVIPYLRGLRGDAAVFGAVNTVVGGVGYNTDGAGFALMLENGGIRPAGRRALVLGAGGAGRSVVKKLLDAGAHVQVFDVNGDGAAAVCREFAGAELLGSVTPEDRYLIVNATGVGMHKSEGRSPVGEDVLSRCEAAVDLIYVPRQSEFLRLAAGLGKRTLNGEGMLFYQAYFADCLVLGRAPRAEEAKALFEQYREVYQA